jgi:hypothetical protein
METQMRCVLPSFDLAEMLRCGREIRRVIGAASTLEEGAQQMCELLYDGLVDTDEATRACVLVRCFKTHPLGELPEDVRASVAEGGAGLSPTSKTLMLVGTSGAEAAWKSRHRSKGHKAIPLPSADVVKQAPMIAGLLSDLGVEIQHLVAPEPATVRNVATKTYGVFYVGNAAGSPLIPAQEDFVAPYGVKSVIGCGGELPRDEMFATILFCRVPVSHQVAERFRTLALDMKSSFFSFSPTQTFQAA